MTRRRLSPSHRRSHQSRPSPPPTPSYLRFPRPPPPTSTPGSARRASARSRARPPHDCGPDRANPERRDAHADQRRHAGVQELAHGRGAAMPSLMNGCVSACVTVIRFSGSKVNICRRVPFPLVKVKSYEGAKVFDCIRASIVPRKSERPRSSLTRRVGCTPSRRLR